MQSARAALTFSFAQKKTTRNIIRVVPDRRADVSPPAKCIHASQGVQILLLWSRRSLPFPTLLRYIIATLVYRRKCLFQYLSKFIFGYRQEGLILLNYAHALREEPIGGKRRNRYSGPGRPTVIIPSEGTGRTSHRTCWWSKDAPDALPQRGTIRCGGLGSRFGTEANRLFSRNGKFAESIRISDRNQWLETRSWRQAVRAGREFRKGNRDVPRFSGPVLNRAARRRLRGSEHPISG